MRNRSLLLGTLAIVVIVATIGVVGYSWYVSTQAYGPPYPGLAKPISVVCPAPDDWVATQGIIAIHPRNDCTPSFTQRDVRDFLAQGASMVLIGAAGPTKVTRVVFLTIADLGRVTGDSEWTANYPPDLVVCYAQLSGTFYPNGPPEYIPKKVSAAFIVFDGQTGNELTLGTGALLG